jgi:hypothetical protein
MTRLIADAGEIGEFAKAVFPYASDGAVISLRTFDDGGSDRPLSILPVRLNGVGLEPLIDAAAEQAQFAADHGKKANFCPPIAGFSDLAKADEGHLVEGYTLSVECDQKPQEARQKLEPLFGPATIVVASGGRWLDPDTGELQQKLHLHWRLNEPARDVDLARLKEARKLAATLVGGDLSNVPVTHPIRWAGSWHRKGEPCLARIIAKSANEIGLSDALETLRLVSSETEEKPFEKADGDKKRQDDRPTAALIDNIRTGCEFNPSIVPLAARLIGSGMKPGAVVNFIRELMEEVPANRRDGRWQLRFDCIPQWVATAEAKFGRRADNEEASGTSKKGAWSLLRSIAFSLSRSNGFGSGALRVGSLRWLPATPASGSRKSATTSSHAPRPGEHGQMAAKRRSGVVWCYPLKMALPIRSARALRRLALT